MTVKSLRKQLAAAIAMTLVASVALGSSTYAWFAINSTVTATGAQFKTEVQNNLFIASNTGNAKAAESEFVTTIKEDIDALLEPVSTVNGINYFYADKNNVINTGATKTSDWIVYPADPTATGALNDFNTNYGTTGAVGYVDYVYQLKAVSASATTIILNKLDLTYGGDSDASGTDANLTPRIAIFAQDITESNASALAAGDLQMIYSNASAEEFTNNKAVSGVKATDTVTKNAAISLAVKAPSVANYNHGTYYKITVRMWLEGEDKTCNNATFADLKDKWSLDMAWSLAGTTGATAVTGITTADTATKTTATGVTVTDSATTNVVNDGVTYYITDQTLGTNNDPVYTLSTTISGTSRYFTYVDGVLREVTNQVSYTGN